MSDSTPKPTTTSITVAVRRVVRQAPYESAEVALSITAEPDPAFGTAANVDRIHGLLTQLVERYAGEARDENGAEGATEAA